MRCRRTTQVPPVTARARTLGSQEGCDTQAIGSKVHTAYQTIWWLSPFSDAGYHVQGTASWLDLHCGKGNTNGLLRVIWHELHAQLQNVTIRDVQRLWWSNEDRHVIFHLTGFGTRNNTIFRSSENPCRLCTRLPVPVQNVG